MRRAIAVTTHTAQAAAATVTLPYFERHRRRVRMTDDGGTDFLLDLPTAVLLADGDHLLLEDGGSIAVRAAMEAVIDISCRDGAHAARIAWHIGNRHMPLQVLPDGRLRVAADHVLEDMIQGLGGKTEARMAPFEPEGGAYGSNGHHHHA